MKSYKNAGSTLYVATPKLIYGYQNRMHRYLQRYPIKEKMGTLTSSDIKIKLLSSQYAYVIGAWHLKRPQSGDIGGIITLLYEKTPAGWKIIADHTS